MTNAADEIILHNYPQSPVAEKVRVALGIKGLAWRSVELPRLPPKPLRTPPTGGYRRTPVMQIGADIYCDSQCIIRELERRHPQPTFFPTSDAGLMWILSRWTDGALFDLAVKVVLGSAGDSLPPEFAEDRGRLYLGSDWAEGLKAANANLPHLVAQLRAPLSWLNDVLSDGRPYLLGNEPAAIDAQFYHVVWFVGGRWDQGEAMLSEFPALVKWTQAIAALGHGTVSDMTPEAAMDRAAACTPVEITSDDAKDPQGLQPGMRIVVSPDVDGGEQPVEGVVKASNAEMIAIGRTEPRLGDLCVQFPRTGYRVERIDR
ncbi:MAG: glutathione S-transferase family protein [Hyphomicrobiaceae bacterium]